MKKIENYVDYCKDFAINKLEENKSYNNSIYGADLANTLTESINVDGSATYSSYEAKEYIKEWFNEAGEVYEYQKSNYGEVCQNPFENPEGFHVCMIIEGVNNIMSNCATIEKYWNDELELTDEIIDNLINEVKQVKEIEF